MLIETLALLYRNLSIKLPKYTKYQQRLSGVLLVHTIYVHWKQLEEHGFMLIETLALLLLCLFYFCAQNLLQTDSQYLIYGELARVLLHGASIHCMYHKSVIVVLYVHHSDKHRLLLYYSFCTGI